jgi:hypothetical protein
LSARDRRAATPVMINLIEAAALRRSSICSGWHQSLGTISM